MKKSLVLLPILVALGILPAFAQAQPSAGVPRIGFLTRNPKGFTAQIRKGLRELGYVEGKSIVIELRSTRGMRQRSEAAAELVRLEPDVIVTTDTGSTSAIKRATQSIPVVFMALGDPVRNGLVDSFAQPGGNITGVTGNGDEFRIKLLEILKESFPTISRVRIVKWGRNRIPKGMVNRARELGIDYQMRYVKTQNNIDKTFSAIMDEKVDGIVIWAHARMARNRKLIVKLAEKSGLPVIYQRKLFVHAGGLMSYGADIQELSKRTAHLVDKILKGAKPRDIPVERPVKGELVINLRTAKKQGFTFSPEVLMFADEVIK